jgi:beta-lactamase superfamily II metal-dependent hydrolase
MFFGAHSAERELPDAITLAALPHGSAYSSSAAFIAAVHPRFAIVSVGDHNLFGHPAPTTLETWRRGKRSGASAIDISRYCSAGNAGIERR